MQSSRQIIQSSPESRRKVSGFPLNRFDLSEHQAFSHEKPPKSEGQNFPIWSECLDKRASRRDATNTDNLTILTVCSVACSRLPLQANIATTCCLPARSLGAQLYHTEREILAIDSLASPPSSSFCLMIYILNLIIDLHLSLSNSRVNKSSGKWSEINLLYPERQA